jgi:hypothetical protein
MLTVPPPVKPVARMQTNQRPLKMYTLHENMNNALALRAEKNNDKTAMIAFTRHTDVLTMGRMLENHYRTYKEWPDMVIDNSIKIYSGSQGTELQFLQAAEWSPEELTNLCCSHYMDILQIDELFETSTGYRIKGSRLMLEGSYEMYIQACKNMYRLIDDGFSTEMDW